MYQQQRPDKRLRVVGKTKAKIALEVIPEAGAELSAGCSGCASQTNGCPSKRRQIVVSASSVAACQPGDVLTFNHSDDQVLSAALAGYGLPLLGFLIGALMGQWWLGELASVLMGIGGLITPLLFLR